MKVPNDMNVGLLSTEEFLICEVLITNARVPYGERIDIYSSAA